MERLNAFTDWLAKVWKGAESVLGVMFVLGLFWYGVSWLGDRFESVLAPYRWVVYLIWGALVAAALCRWALNHAADRIAARVAERLRDLDLQDPHWRVPRS